jgi:hypothetical protein
VAYPNFDMAVTSVCFYKFSPSSIESIFNISFEKEDMEIKSHVATVIRYTRFVSIIRAQSFV